jgi:TonB family protein
MTATAYPPAARLLPVWLGVSLAIHAVALLGADALIAAGPQPSPALQKTRVVFAGRAVTPLPPQPEQVAPEIPAVATPAPQRTRYSRPARRAGHDARTSARGATPRPQTPPSQTAGGGSQLLTTGGGGPVGFQVASGGGGSRGGVVGGGVPGGTGLSSGGGASVSAGGGARGTGPGGTGEGGSGPGPSSSPGGPGSRPAPQVRPAPTPDPPPPPKPKRSQADLSRFRSMVQARITGARRYPSSARDADQHGTVRVSFRVSPGGQPSGISVASSSGYQSLDAAARRAVSAAGPYRPFPKHMSSSIRVTATVIFRLN